MALRPQTGNRPKNPLRIPTERPTRLPWAITPETQTNPTEAKGTPILSRNRNSAKKAGARFERLISDYLRDNLDDRIDRRVKTGAKDCGDVANVRDSHNRRIVIEAKNTTRPNLAGWIKEAHQEAHNDNAHIGVVVHKRHGNANPADQWVTLTVNDLIQLLTPPQGNTQ